MTTLTRPRRSPAQRLGWAIVPASTCAVGVLVGARLSGYDVDLGLVGIVALAALGVWLLVTAAVAGMRDRSAPVYAQTPSDFAAQPFADDSTLDVDASGTRKD